MRISWSKCGGRVVGAWSPFPSLSLLSQSSSEFFLGFTPFQGIMGKNLWRELKHRYNITELEVPELREEDASPLKVNRKRKRGAKEVGGTSAPPDAEEVTSKAADAGAVDLIESPSPKGAPQVAPEEVAQTAEQVAQSAEVEMLPRRRPRLLGRPPRLAAEVVAPATEQVAHAAEARSEVPIADFLVAEQGAPASASVEARPLFFCSLNSCIELGFELVLG
ncbi:uncharacterized protein LOC114915231 [Cajanus cajan]|uniref:uncharacterized protein LOC114915231 n=1 Tax=Cajanus cajan TaxID=3821 RepID=UPI0010FB00F2|nr:uncharacterized protein LOC114915231 [Cajanus cajan]